METVPAASSLFKVQISKSLCIKWSNTEKLKHHEWLMHVGVPVYLMAAPTYSPAITVKHTFVSPNRVGLAGSGLKQVWYRV